MEQVLDFVRAAALWVAIGMFVGLAVGMCIPKKKEDAEK